MRWIWIDRFVEFTPKVSATAIKNVLQEAGISSTLRGGLHDAYPGTSGLGAIDILVSEDDLALAQDVLSRAETTGLEPELDDEA